jgi:hypothetical protein
MTKGKRKEQKECLHSSCVFLFLCICGANKIIKMLSIFMIDESDLKPNGENHESRAKDEAGRRMNDC